AAPPLAIPSGLCSTKKDNAVLVNCRGFLDDGVLASATVAVHGGGDGWSTGPSTRFARTLLRWHRARARRANGELGLRLERSGRWLGALRPAAGVAGRS